MFVIYALLGITVVYLIIYAIGFLLFVLEEIGRERAALKHIDELEARLALMEQYAIDLFDEAEKGE